MKFSFLFLSFYLLLGSWQLAVAACNQQTIPINQIQSEADRSPYVGQVVWTEGIVSALFLTDKSLNGFFIQTPLSQLDNNAQTSEGLFVYQPKFSMINGLSEGDHIQIQATVKEFKTKTELVQIKTINLCSRQQAVQRTRIKLPLNAQQRESLENMLVKFDTALSIRDLNYLHRYGQLTVATAADKKIEADDYADRIFIDDAQKKRANPFMMSEQAYFRVGDEIAQLEGILSFDFDAYRVYPIKPIKINKINPRPTIKPPGALLRVASLNVLNLFNGDGQGRGFPTERGAHNKQEYERQLEKLVSTIIAIDADILGLIELENDTDENDSALSQLLDALKKSNMTYLSVDKGRELFGNDAIRVAIIYQTRKVQLFGQSQTLTKRIFDQYNRQPQIQFFKYKSTGESFGVMLNHFKSKNCKNQSEGSKTISQSQGCWEEVRVQAAHSIMDWLRQEPQTKQNFIVMGDLNSYPEEAPIRVLSQSLRNTILEFEPQAYSYNHKGWRGLLDYMLLTSTLHKRTINAGVWHINADEAPVLDYRIQAKSPAHANLFQGNTAYRSSDHDPVYLDLKLDP